jgi:hypothetical protein
VPGRERERDYESHTPLCEEITKREKRKDNKKKTKGKEERKKNRKGRKEKKREKRTGVKEKKKNRKRKWIIGFLEIRIC